MSKKALVILRHAKSLGIVENFANENGFITVSVAMDPIELPDGMPHALQSVKKNVAACDIVAMGTKVYNDVKDGPSRLPQFLDVLKSYGIGNKPLCLTHLVTFTDAEKNDLQKSGLNVSWTEDDNLGRNGMEKFGPLLLNALK